MAERIAEEAHLGEDIQKKYALPDADFAIAFDQWTVTYADGAPGTSTPRPHAG